MVRVSASSWPRNAEVSRAATSASEGSGSTNTRPHAQRRMRRGGGGGARAPAAGRDDGDPWRAAELPLVTAGPSRVPRKVPPAAPGIDRAERAAHRQAHAWRRPPAVHVSPGGQPPRHKGNSPPHGSNGLVVVVVAWVVGVVVDVDVVVGGVVVVVVVSGTVAVVVVVDVDVVRGVVLLVVGVGDAVARNVASTMFQLVAEPKVRLPTC